MLRADVGREVKDLSIWILLAGLSYDVLDLSFRQRFSGTVMLHAIGIDDAGDSGVGVLRQMRAMASDDLRE